jgi:hypothetical protein
LISNIIFQLCPPDHRIHPKQDGKPLKGGNQKQKDVIMKDARRLDRKLDQHSFELVKHQTLMSTEDFYDVAKIRDVYYKEMEECIAGATGADRVIVLHHIVRNQDKKDDDEHNIAAPVQGTRKTNICK